jgi:aminoglycoside phosphotransferase (APT) family kinase protein
MAVGLCHGDLNRDNLLCAEDGRLWLIDWERAGVIPLAQDLGRLYVIDPKLKSAILDLLGSLDPAREALSPVHQLALGAAFELFKHIRSRAWCLDYEMSAKGRTLEEAAAIVDRRAMEARAALADVAG